jgi:hypothetical protein
VSSNSVKIPYEFIFSLSSGKVYRGTWNQTEVAIKVLQNVAGVTPSLVVGNWHTFGIILPIHCTGSYCERKSMFVCLATCTSDSLNFLHSSGSPSATRISCSF